MNKIALRENRTANLLNAISVVGYTSRAPVRGHRDKGSRGRSAVLSRHDNDDAGLLPSPNRASRFGLKWLFALNNAVGEVKMSGCSRNPYRPI